MLPEIQKLIRCVEWEEKEQTHRYRLDEQHSLKSLKAEGLALHPLVVTRKNFGFADYPEISFRIDFPPETNSFRDGCAIECFVPGEEPVKGILLDFENTTGSFRLFAPDFPDWIEEKGLCVKLAPDTRTTTVMKKALNEIENNKSLLAFFQLIHGNQKIHSGTNPKTKPIQYKNNNLNESQQLAVQAVLQNEQLAIIHGPPGTGKTTTLIEAIVQLARLGKKTVLSAPSNTAVDHIAKGLIREGINLLRVGNTSKADEAVFAYTPEGKLSSGNAMREIKELRKKADAFRKMALKYKRNFGKAEREQRALLFKEVKSIRDEIRLLEQYHEEKLFSEATVIAGTPIGLYDAGLEAQPFDTLIIDEAGQCIEPLAWCVFPLAPKIVLAGDHWQLPPTVLSREAAELGFNRSILEAAILHSGKAYLLDIQYRMRPTIAGFSSSYFYDGLLQTASHLPDSGIHLTFIDTAGSGFEEKQGPDGFSLQNEGEMDIIKQVLDTNAMDLAETAFIAPYSGQVTLAKTRLPAGLRISTIDSFQGQEMSNIILSLVRSNEDGDIGFLKDYRRMNVAITRAKEHLLVIGDSATIGADPFYKKFLEYAEKNGNYRTVWEFEMT